MNHDNIWGWRDPETLTAYPLNGKRLELLDIDHELIKILVHYAVEELIITHNNLWESLQWYFYKFPERYKHENVNYQIIATLDSALQCWRDDLFNRMESDRPHGKSKPLPEIDRLKIEQLNKIINHSRESL